MGTLQAGDTIAWPTWDGEDQVAYVTHVDRWYLSVATPDGWTEGYYAAPARWHYVPRQVWDDERAAWLQAHGQVSA